MQPTVLVVDDDRMIRQILEDMLGEAGFRVIPAEDGEEGCRLARAVQPDVILVDLVMPGMDGLAFCDYLKKQPDLAHTPILLMTAYPETEGAVNPFQVGADDYVAKPFIRTELVARIKGVLLKRQFLQSDNQKARHYDALLDITETVVSVADAGTALKEIVRKISQHLEDVDRCSIALIREDEDCGYVLATTADLLRPSFRIDLKNYPEIRQVMATGKPLLIEDVARNPLMADILPVFADRDIGAIMVFPVIHPPRVIGAMMIRIAHRNGGIPFEDIGFCRLVSNVVVAALKSNNFFDVLWEEAESLRQVKCRLEEDLRIKEIYEQLFENASEGLIAFSDSGRVAYANRHMLELLGYERTELQGRSLVDLFGREVEGLLQACLKQKSRQQTCRLRFDMPFTTRSGQDCTFSVSVSDALPQDGLQVAAFREVTDRRRIEEDLVRIKATLEQTNAQLLQVDRARVEFLSTATHELRTPVTIVSGYCGLLAETEQSRLSEEQRSYITEVVDAADRLSDLINNLLDLSRPDTGKLTVEARPGDLVKSVSRFLRDYESLIDKKSLHLSTQFPETCTALYDEEMIYRVLANLFGNAVKFTPAAGKIRVCLENVGDQARLVIEDTGKGIPKESFSRLFQEFSQVDKQDSRSGSGLGLYISRKIIEAHHGRIWVESQVGQGSRFFFSLPKPS